MQVADISKFKPGGGLGISLEGTQNPQGKNGMAASVVLHQRLTDRGKASQVVEKQPDNGSVFLLMVGDELNDLALCTLCTDGTRKSRQVVLKLLNSILY